MQAAYDSARAKLDKMPKQISDGVKSAIELLPGTLEYFKIYKNFKEMCGENVLTNEFYIISSAKSTKIGIVGDENEKIEFHGYTFSELLNGNDLNQDEKNFIQHREKKESSYNAYGAPLVLKNADNRNEYPGFEPLFRVNSPQAEYAGPCITEEDLGL